MSSDDRLAILERKLQYLTDRSDPSYQRPLTTEGGERW